MGFVGGGIHMSYISAGLSQHWAEASPTAPTHRTAHAPLAAVRSIREKAPRASFPVAALVILGLATPALLAFASKTDPSLGSSVLLGTAFSAVELPLLMYAVHRLLDARRLPRGEAT